MDTLVGYRTIVFDMGNEIHCNNMQRIILNPFKDAERSFALVQYADIVITVDTAIVHLASVFNIKQYCIYNNRMLHSLYDNNILWGPNSAKATQLFTSENVKSECGDDMRKFKIPTLVKAMENDFHKKNFRTTE